MTTDLAETIRRAALALLARRDYSTQVLFQKLMMKHHAKEIVETVLQQLTASGYLSDLRFAEHYIHAKYKKGHGPLRIKFELQQQGISQEMIAEALKITDNAADDWLATARSLLQKHFKGKRPKDFREKAKQMRFLQYRGFTAEQIAAVLGKE